MALFIVPLTGPKSGLQIPLHDGFIIGRKNGDLILEEDSKVSGTHAKVSIDNKNQFILLDQNSSNGLILNRRKVKKVALMPGVIFTIGQTEFRVIEGDLIPSASPSTSPLPLEVPVRRGPLTWREKITEFWEQKEPMIAGPSEEKPLAAFSPALVLDFVEGIQADQKMTLGYGPRQAGFDHLDIDLQDPTIPDEAFELRPGPGMVELVDLSHGQVFINNDPAGVTFLEDGDIISVGQTKIKVRYL